MNLFISLVGQAYDDAMSKQQMKMFRSRAIKNEECYSIYNYLDLKLGFSKMIGFE